MKNIIFLSITCLISSNLVAQAEGNFKAARSQSVEINAEDMQIQQYSNPAPAANSYYNANQSIYTPTDNSYARNITFAGDNIMTLNNNKFENQHFTFKKIRKNSCENCIIRFQACYIVVFICLLACCN